MAAHMFMAAQLTVAAHRPRLTISRPTDCCSRPGITTATLLCGAGRYSTGWPPPCLVSLLPGAATIPDDLPLFPAGAGGGGTEMIDSDGVDEDA